MIHVSHEIARGQIYFNWYIYVFVSKLKWSFFFTEPVFASLANLLGRHDNLPSPLPAQIRDYKMFDVEIKYGLLQVMKKRFV